MYFEKMGCFVVGPLKHTFCECWWILIRHWYFTKKNLKRLAPTINLIIILYIKKKLCHNEVGVINKWKEHDNVLCHMMSQLQCVSVNYVTQNWNHATVDALYSGVPWFGTFYNLATIELLVFSDIFSGRFRFILSDIYIVSTGS